jgi:phage gp29-like protein
MIAPSRLHQTGNGSVSTGNGIEFFPVNHANTFQGRASTMASTYREYDVALRNSIENARLMRNDSSIMECLEARQRAVALLKWHIEPEDDRSLEQKQLAEEMTKVMMRTPRFMEMRRVLQEAVWYGKSAVQVMYNTDWIGGYRRFCILSPDRDTPAWLPIHGDKLVFRHDDLTEFDRSKGRYPFQVGIRVGGSYQKGQKVRGKYEVEPVASQFRGTEAVDRGMAYFVDQEDRQKLIIHKHSIEDGAYEDILSAGSIHGVGVRSRIYWDWIQKQEIQAMLLAYIERYHGGIEIYRFPLGNDEAEKAVDSAIRNRQPGRAALKVPIPMGEDAMQYGVEVFESSMAGVQQMQDLLTNFYGHRIKRYILGQILSSESEATGLGSGVADLHLESLLQIIEYDATGLEETITEEPLRRLQHSNFPSSRGIRLRFKIDTREADSDSKLDAVRQAWEMGARVKESDVLDKCGLSAPTASDRILPAPGGGQGQQPPGLPGMAPAGPPKVQASVPDNVTSQPEAEPAKYSYAAQEPDLRSAIEKAAAATDPEPTNAQKLAGNYRKGQFHWNGWTIAIEVPAGGMRRGRNSLGVEWSHQIPVHYGYIRRTESDADGDHIDVFVGPDPESNSSYGY